MSEHCPLINYEIYWREESGPRAIPEFCINRCGQRMEDAIDQAKYSFDSISESCDDSDPCTHDVEHGGTSLQSLGSSRRIVSELSVCAYNGTELFAEQHDFECPVASD